MKRELKLDCTSRSRLYLPTDIKKYLKDEHIWQYFLRLDSLIFFNYVEFNVLLLYIIYTSYCVSLNKFFMQFICMEKWN